MPVQETREVSVKETREMSVKGLFRELPVKETRVIVQELCESRGGCPGLSVLTSLLVSVDVKIY